MSKDSNYWRSFEELHNKTDDGFDEVNTREFVEGTFDEVDLEKMTSVDRRRFLGLLGASAAFAGVGCSDYRDQGVVVPYNKKPAEITIGRPNFYATTADESCDSIPVLVKTREGRPIKIDGNADHPTTRGKINSAAQASILGLYDPDRIRGPLKKDAEAKEHAAEWSKLDVELIQALVESTRKGKKIVIVTPRNSSPAAQEVISRFKSRFGTVQALEYDPLFAPNSRRAWFKSYGDQDTPVINLSDAEIIVDLDSDFLGKGRHKLEYRRQMAERRDSFNVDKFNRLYSIEGGLSLTGIAADHRLRLRPDAMLGLVLSIAQELVGTYKIGSHAKDSSVINLLKSYSLGKFADQNGIDKVVLNAMVADLAANQGRSILFVGEHHDEMVHLAVNFVNEVLGSRRLWGADYYSDSANLADVKAINELVGAMNAGNVGVIIHAGTNPVYHLPSGLGYSSALKKVPTRIALSMVENETTRESNYVLPLHHYLESWGDVSSRSGIYNLRQPVIKPLHSSRQWEHVLLSWSQANHQEDGYHKFLKEFWKNEIFPQIQTSQKFEFFWNSALHDGLVKVASSRKVWRYDHLPFLQIARTATTPPAASSFVVRLSPSYHLGSGEHANNGWLQENPHPVSKVVWDNYAAVSKDTAAKLGVKADDLIAVQVGDRKVKLPVFIQPGTAENTVTVELGYGRSNGGTVGTGVGHNVVKLLGVEELGQFILPNAKVSKEWGTYEVVSTQAHWAFQDDVPAMLKELTVDAHKRRQVIFENDLLDHKKDPKWLASKMAKKRSHIKSIYVEEHKYTDVKWGMAIDLNQCNGCMDCIVACNAENNIPVVGKEQVKKNREMHWMRIDRYYSGTAEEPVVSVQPMLCQQCDNAPCENVCPVAATTHTPDGLNGMAYNRCVGTRYCANNCPYKVRRFNFLNYRRHFRNSHQEAQVASLAHNPEVSVRSRGVMEKCTFCVQRIMDARSEAKREKRALKGSDVTVACQDACPSNAIKFGDTNDKESIVSKYIAHELEYKIMEELMVKPNVTYMAKIRNKSEEARS